MNARELGIGFEDRDLSSGLGCFLAHIMHEFTRRTGGMPVEVNSQKWDLYA